MVGWSFDQFGAIDQFVIVLNNATSGDTKKIVPRCSLNKLFSDFLVKKNIPHTLILNTQSHAVESERQALNEIKSVIRRFHCLEKFCYLSKA